jgi:hypothetical protein
MSGLMIEVKSGPLRVRVHQEECSNTPEYVEMMMRLAGERLVWVQEKTFSMDDVDEDELTQSAQVDAEKLSELARAEAALEKRASDDGPEPASA